jgi:adenosine deaminase CECR1
MAVILAVLSAHGTHAKSVAEFLAERNDVLAAEASQSLGADVVLNELEQMVNDVLLMSVKIAELNSAFVNDDLPSSRNFLTAKPMIDRSDVFQFIRGMPKGAALHLHELSITSVDWVVSNVTYRFVRKKELPNAVRVRDSMWCMRWEASLRMWE